MKRSLPFLPLLILISGCREQTPAPHADPSETVQFHPEGVKIMQPVAGQRFTPTSSALVSYDTRTGQLCKTYGWGGSVNETGITPCQWLLNTPVETAKAP